MVLHTVRRPPNARTAHIAHLHSNLHKALIQVRNVMGSPTARHELWGFVLSSDEVARLLQGRNKRVLAHEVYISNRGAKRHKRNTHICGVARRVVAAGLHKHMDRKARVERHAFGKRCRALDAIDFDTHESAVVFCAHAAYASFIHAIGETSAEHLGAPTDILVLNDIESPHPERTGERVAAIGLAVCASRHERHCLCGAEHDRGSDNAPTKTLSK